MRIYYEHFPAPEVESKNLKGSAVYDGAGQRIGKLKRLMIDRISGRISSVDVARGGFLGIGARHYTLAWEKLVYDSGLEGYRALVADEPAPLTSPGIAEHAVALAPST